MQHPACVSRWVSALVALTFISFTLACGGGGIINPPPPPPPTVPPPPPAPPPAPKATLKATPDTVHLGQSTTLTKGCTEEATSATRSWSPSGAPSNFNGDEVVTPTTAGNIKYGYTCTGVGGSTTAEVMVVVLLPLTLEVQLSAKVPTDFSTHRLYVSRGGLIDSLNFDANGHAKLVTRFIDGECIDVIVDEKDPARRVFFRSKATGEDQLCGPDYRNKVWPLDRFQLQTVTQMGEFAGQAFDYSLLAAFSKVGADNGLFRRNKNLSTGGKSSYKYDFPVAKFPFNIALDRERSDEVIPDSLGGPENLGRLAIATGRPELVGKWVKFSEVNFIPWPPERQGDLGGDWFGTALRIKHNRDPGGASVVDSSGYIVQGLLTIPTLECLKFVVGGAACNAILLHEWLHIIFGWGHSTRGIMRHSPSGQDPDFAMVTREDVANIEFYLENAPIRVKLSNSCSIHYAVAGEYDMRSIPAAERDPTPCDKSN